MKYKINKQQQALLRDEFYQLREDDKDFAIQYKENEFWSWYKDQGYIKINN